VHGSLQVIAAQLGAPVQGAGEQQQPQRERLTRPGHRPDKPVPVHQGAVEDVQPRVGGERERREQVDLRCLGQQRPRWLCHLARRLVADPQSQPAGVPRRGLGPYLVEGQAQARGEPASLLDHVGRLDAEGQVDDGEVAGPVAADLLREHQRTRVLGQRRVDGRHSAGGDRAAHQLGGELAVVGPVGDAVDDGLVGGPVHPRQRRHRGRDDQHAYPPRRQAGPQHQQRHGDGQGADGEDPPAPAGVPLAPPVDLQPDRGVVTAGRVLHQRPGVLGGAGPSQQPADGQEQPHGRPEQRLSEVLGAALGVQPGDVRGVPGGPPGGLRALLLVAQPRRYERLPVVVAPAGDGAVQGGPRRVWWINGRAGRFGADVDGLGVELVAVVDLDEFAAGGVRVGHAVLSVGHVGEVGPVVVDLGGWPLWCRHGVVSGAG
jgi:hypothetical protein